jgi:hypothetical protein
LQCLIQLRMSVFNAATDRCAERLSFLVVSSANQRSTRFSHDAPVGVKWKMKALVGEKPALDRLGLVRGVVIKDEVYVELVGQGPRDPGKHRQDRL